MDGRRIFTVSELYGPLPCEHKEGDVKCEKEAFAILLSAEENASLPEDSGPVAVRHILRKGVGIVLCEEHLPTE